MQAARAGKSGYFAQKEKCREDLKTIMAQGHKLKKHQKWMFKELGNTIENFNEMFINNLSQSLTHVFIANDEKKRFEDEEEEGDHVFKVEVVAQKAQELEYAQKAGNKQNIGSEQILPQYNNEEAKVEVL